MSIETIGKDLIELGDKIKAEKGLGADAKQALLTELDNFEATIAKSVATVRAAISSHLDYRGDALDALVSEPAQQDIAKVA